MHKLQAVIPRTCGDQVRHDVKTLESQVKEEWIKFVIDHPEKTEYQADGRIRKWAKIKPVDKYLRVILLEDGETVYNAFFDRSFKGEA